MSKSLEMICDNIPFSGWTTTATPLMLFPTNVLVTCHVIQDLVTCLSILKTVSTHPQFQLQLLLLQPQALLLLPVNIQMCQCTVMLHDLHLQCLVTNMAHCGVDYIYSQIVMVEHSNSLVTNGFQSHLALNWCSV